MASACPDCGDEDLVTDFRHGRLVLLCSSCGTEVDPQTDKENESGQSPPEIYDSSWSDADDIDRVDVHGSVKQSAEDSKIKEGTQTRTTCANCKGNNLVHDRETEQLVCEDCYTEHDRGSPHPLTTDADNTEQILTTAPPTKICKGCGGTNLVHDTDHDTEQWVCEDCGYFIEEYALVSTQDFTNIAGTSDTYRWTPAPKPRFANDSQQINKGQESGVKTIKDVTARLSWRSDLTDQAVALFERVYPHKLVKFTANELKDALGVCCIYSVARENGEKVTLRTLIGFHNVKKKLITRALKLLKEIDNKPLAAQSVSSLPEHILAPANLPKALVDKISKLVNACEKGFVSQGRDHTNVVISVAHLAWISEDFAARRSVRLPKFCTQHGLKFGRHVTLVQKDVIELFIKLAGQLPWVSTEVGKHNYIHYLDNIASYSSTMVSRASSKGPDTVVTTGEISDTLPDQQTTAVRILPPLAPPSMKTTRGPIIVDPSQLQVPANLSAEDLDCEVLKENEFSEQEISSYILTPQEAQVKECMIRL